MTFGRKVSGAMVTITADTWGAKIVAVQFYRSKIWEEQLR